MPATEGPDSHPAIDIGCGVLGRYPNFSVVGFATLGVGIGVILSHWTPDNLETKSKVLAWVGLTGSLFIRALTAIVFPLVFANVVVSTVQMMIIGRVGIVGSQAVLIYATTTLFAATIGLISVLSFEASFKQGEYEGSIKPIIQLGCPKGGTVLTENMTDGSVMCFGTANATTQHNQFEIIDLTAGLVSSSGGLAELSISETIYSGVFTKLVTDNIFQSFVDGNFASVVVFAAVFGICLGRIILKKGQSINTNFIVCLLQEVSEVLLRIINWIIAGTPFAVLSLISNAIGSEQKLSEAFGNVGYFIAANVIGMIIHFLITDVGFFFLASGINPFQYLKHIIPAQATAFACASSAATLPVTLRCIKKTGMVSDDIRNFVCPLGATMNMDGTAVYFPCACIWLAALNGVDHHFGSYILVIILSCIGSLGTAPVPASSLVLVITAYNTVFGASGIPSGFEYVVAVEWFLDRCRTAMNVTGDAVVSAIISARMEPTPFLADIISSS